MIRHDVAIGLAKVEDAGELSLISKNLIEQGFVWRWRESKIREAISNQNKNVVVARDNGRTLGFAIMHYGDSSANLDLLAVLENCRREGIGRRLVNWLEEVALVAGIEAITVQVVERNIAAQRFYRKLGYTRVDLLRAYYQGIENAIMMKKVLSRAEHGAGE